jgi:HD-GYP domain-containing protein (c-di-GMP phosphodiesterase class II)
MTEPTFEIESVNKHYLDKVMDLAEEMDVEATEDIFDSRGMKLIAKGAKISRNLQEKLIMHKLKKPLESCITVEGGVNPNTIFDEAQRIAETIEPVACILRSTGSVGVGPLDVMSDIKLGSAMNVMLTIIERGGSSALEHCVMVGLISVCLANRMGLSEKDQKVIAMAGLLHDIGELYIEPEYLQSKRRLLAHEWRHVVVHPRVGEMLIRELENCPSEVAVAVSEHHERFNGAGYPRQLSGKKISVAGQAVSVAETISGVFMKRDRPLERAEMALKIVPGEYPHTLVSAISSALRATGRAGGGENASAEEPSKMAQSLSERISAVLQNGSLMLDTAVLPSPKSKSLLSNALERIQVIQRAFISTGLDICLNEGPSFFEGRSAQLLFEAAVGAKEIQWRLHDVARDLSLHAASLENQENEALQPFIALLDEE